MIPSGRFYFGGSPTNQQQSNGYESLAVSGRTLAGFKKAGLKLHPDRFLRMELTEKEKVHGSWILIYVDHFTMNPIAP